MNRKIQFLIHRASVMPFAEYLYRVKRLITGLMDVLFITIGRASSPAIISPRENILKITSNMDIFDKCDHGILPVEYQKKCIRDADHILDHQFSFFEFKNHGLGDKINWNFDYKNELVSPMRYSVFHNFKSFNNTGDIKYIFELNKHQEVVRLAEAFILTKNELFTNKIVELISSWMVQSPYMRGVNWSSPTVMSYRLVNWTIALEMLKSEYDFPDDFLANWARSVYQHVCVIRKNYSKYSSAGNHLVSEAVGVFIACIRWKDVFQERDQILLETAQKEAHSILLGEIKEQIYPDGVNHEQAISYQVFTASQFLIALIFGCASGVTFPEDYRNRLYACARFLTAILNKNGIPPNFGDEDAAWAFCLCDRNSNKYIDQIGVFAVFFTDISLLSTLKSQTAHLPETAYWLFGSQAVRTGVKLAESKSIPYENTQRGEEKFFSDGGYYVAAFDRSLDSEVIIFFDCGPVGLKATGAHGHADALSICLSLGGNWVFVDPGTYHYKETLQRKTLRATSSHNTLGFGELTSQDRYLGPFLWGKRHQATGKQVEAGRFRGRVKWWTGEEHSREISVAQNKLHVEDQWAGERSPLIVFNISQELSSFVSMEGDDTAVITAEKCKCILRAVGCRISVEPVNISPGFYQLVESKRIVIAPREICGKQRVEIEWEFN